MDFTTLEDKAKKEYSKLESSHGWEHIQRVKANAEYIGKKEAANFQILIPATLLHDLGHINTENIKEHSMDNTLAEKILSEIETPMELKEEIINCIKTHSFNTKNEPLTIEAKVLYDADKIDSYGNLGIARFFLFSGEKKLDLKNASIEAIYRITQITKKGGFQTKTGKELGEKRAARALLFYYKLFEEVGNKEQQNKIDKIIDEKFDKILVKKINEIKEIL